MKKILILIFLVSCSAWGYAQDEEVLTNQSVLDMLDLGFDQDIVISKIQTAKTNFDVSVDALKKLKSQNVSGPIIAAMIKQDKPEEKTGIFWLYDGQEQRIFPTAFSGTKTRTLAAGLTYGIASGKVKSVLNNVSSRNIVKAETPEFMFYFQPFKDNQFTATDWWFRTTTSPNEFVLIVLDVNDRKGIRELETGKANVWVGSDVGVKKGKVVPYDVEDMGNGGFKVVPKEPLEKGEYCFFYQGAIPQGGYNNQSVFDFSIQ